MSIMIPISLKVTQDLMKFGSAKIINWDNTMARSNWVASSRSQLTRPQRDEHTGNAEAKNTAISDDLGQIEVVLSDKARFSVARSCLPPSLMCPLARRPER